MGNGLLRPGRYAFIRFLVPAVLPLPSGTFMAGYDDNKDQAFGLAPCCVPLQPSPSHNLSLLLHSFADSIRIEPPESADSPRRDVTPQDCAPDGVCTDTDFRSQLFYGQHRGSHDAPFSVGWMTTGSCLPSVLIGARVPLFHLLIGFPDLYILSYRNRGARR